MESTFDTLAADYDDHFTDSVVGRAQRGVITQRLQARFAAGDRVIELGCGTGEDAVGLARLGVHVVATDPSAGMLEVTRRKAASESLPGSIHVRQLGADHLDRLDLDTADLDTADRDPDGAFDGVVSNFGALNMADDLAAVSAQLARLVRPNGTAVLCFLGRFVPWEWLWFGLRLAPRAAFRRLRPGGVDWRGTRVRYPSLRTLRRTFRPAWRVERMQGIGVFVPPSYTEDWAARHPQLIDRLTRIDRAVALRTPFTHLGDHVLLELRRR